MKDKIEARIEQMKKELEDIVKQVNEIDTQRKDLMNRGVELRGAINELTKLIKEEPKEG